MTLGLRYRIPQGSTLTLDGTSWCVQQVEKGVIFVRGLECGTLNKFAAAWVQKKIEDFSCEVTTPAEYAKKKELDDFTGGYFRLEQLSQAERLNTRARLCLVLAIERIEEEGYKLTHRLLSDEDIRARLVETAKELAGDRHIFKKARVGSTVEPWEIPQGRTLMKWLKTYRHFERNEIVLMQRHHQKGPQDKKERTKLSPAQRRFVDYVLTIWLSKKKPPLMPLYNLAVQNFSVSESERAAGFVFPTLTTIYNHKNGKSKFVETLGREGEQHAVNLVGAGSTEVRAQAFGSVCETDQQLMSIFINTDGECEAQPVSKGKENEPLGENEVCRLWLHYLLDIATRMSLGWVIAESADSETTMELLRMASRCKERERLRYGCKGQPAPPVIPKKIISDNGTSVRNEKVLAAMMGLGGVYVTGRTYHSNDKPFVESGFGVMENQVVAFEDGYTGGKPGALPGYDSRAKASLSADKLYGIITRYVIDERPHQPHRGTGMFGATPAQKLREVTSQVREIEVVNWKERLRHLGIRKEMTVNSEGVQPFGLPFNSSALQKLSEGKRKRVTVIMDPDHLHKVLVAAEDIAGELIEADLKMTSVRDCTLAEFLKIKENAVENDPEKKVIDDKILSEARARRAAECGMFPDSDDLASYARLSYLERQADKLSSVECRPHSHLPGTTPPGSIMDRARQGAVAWNAGQSEADAPSKGRARSRTFRKTKESKIE